MRGKISPSRHAPTKSNKDIVTDMWMKRRTRIAAHRALTTPNVTKATQHSDRRRTKTVTARVKAAAHEAQPKISLPGLAVRVDSHHLFQAGGHADGLVFGIPPAALGDTQ